ncbi:hypothetical protein GQ457_14G000080 [Hibiscus cannabinus]
MQNERRTDLGWNHGYLADPKNTTNVTCNYCSVVIKGGIYRFKQHLAGGYRNARGCNKCPQHVRQEFIEYFDNKKQEREKMNLEHQYDQTDDFDEEDEMQVLESDPKGKKVKSGVNQSVKRTSQVGPMDVFIKSSTQVTGKQKTINETYKKEQREKACVDFARWMYDAAIPFNALNHPSFKVAINSITRAGIGMKPPSAYEVRVPLLSKEVANTNESMRTHREEWAKIGCSIMSDGWTDQCGRTIINFLVNCSKGSMFLESVDASSYSKTGDKLFELLSRIVDTVGEANVVQVVTDNGSNFVAAGALLMAKYPHLYWTPCAAHCIDLILEDIGAIPLINRVLKRAIQVSSFIYQRSGLLNMMRQFTKQRNFLRPAKTRFATAFITLSSIHKQKDNLRKMFTSQEWRDSKWAKETGGKKIVDIILMPSFWNGIVYALKLSGPLVHALRKVDGEKKPAMGYIYEVMDHAKEAIAASFNENESKYSEVFKIIDKRWECQLHRPLHAAGHFLNPEFFYDNPEIEQCVEVVNGLYDCIMRLVPTLDKQDKIMEELTAYKQAHELFGNPMAIRHRKTKAPAEWWACYGTSTVTLQQFAIKVLSLTCSASGCERNWSTFEHIHSKKRNRLTQSRLNDLVYVKYNRALVQRFNLCDKIDPIALKDIHDSNEWLTGKTLGHAQDEYVFEEDEGLTWGHVATATGVHEERFNLRSRGNTQEESTQ